jgi:hypothetical protein
MTDERRLARLTKAERMLTEINREPRTLIRSGISGVAAEVRRASGGRPAHLGCADGGSVTRNVATTGKKSQSSSATRAICQRCSDRWFPTIWRAVNPPEQLSANLRDIYKDK